MALKKLAPGGVACDCAAVFSALFCCLLLEEEGASREGVRAEMAKLMLEATPPLGAATTEEKGEKEVRFCVILDYTF